MTVYTNEEEHFSALWNDRMPDHGTFTLFSFKYVHGQSNGLQEPVDPAPKLIEAYPAMPDRLIDASSAKGSHVPAAFGANRIIFPVGIANKMFDLASAYIRRSDLHAVTLQEDERYLVYDWEGVLSDMENTKISLCWETTFDQSKPLFCLLNTDSLDLVTILKLYAAHWHS